MSLCEVCRKEKSAVKFRYSPAMCPECFSRVFEKRIKKQLRKEKIVKNLNLSAKKKASNRILLIDNESLKSKVDLFVIKKIIRNPKIAIIEKKSKVAYESIFENRELLKFIAKNKINVIIIPWSCEDEIKYFLMETFAGKRPEYLGFSIKKCNSIFVKLLRNEIEKEIELYAKFKKLRISKIDKEKTEKNEKNFEKTLIKEIDKLEKRYPGTKFAFLKSIDWMHGNI